MQYVCQCEAADLTSETLFSHVNKIYMMLVIGQFSIQNYICYYLEQWGQFQKTWSRFFQRSLWVLFAIFVLSLSCPSTAVDLTMLLSSFSADAVCQHGASLPGDRSPLFGSGSREVNTHPTLPSPPPPLPPLPSPSSPARLGACYPASLRQLHWGLQDQLPCEPSWGFRALTLLDFICEWAFDLRNE